MINWFKSIILISLVSFLVSCEAKPKRYTEYFPEESRNTILAGLVYKQGLEVTNYGTVRDPANRLEWKRCSQGQGFRLAENDCRGVVSGTYYTPLDSGKFGALKFTFCNYPTHDCNEKNFPFALINQSGTVSEAFNSCANDRTGDFTDWRVPTRPELKTFTVFGKNALYDIFSSTVQDYYWTSWSNENDPFGKTAYAISFAQDRWGDEKLAPKDYRYYLRCVRKY